MMTNASELRTRKRRIMRAFRIDEISAVDRPAQQGARMTIMKRAQEEEEPMGFEEAVNTIYKRDGGSRCAAMSKAASEFPALLAKYNDEGLQLVDEARREPISKAEAVTKWHQLVAATRSRDGCSNVDAMRRAADEHPAELKAYREA